MFKWSALAAGIVTAAVVFAAPAGAASHPRLIGTVGKNGAFRITLTDAGGNLVKNLKAGTYTLVIHDDAATHSYELDGPNGKAWTFTSVPFVGTKTETLLLSPGKYKAYCSAHESTMFQHFTVS